MQMQRKLTRATEISDPDVRYPEIDPSDWSDYDIIIKDIKSETDMAKRVI